MSFDSFLETFDKIEPLSNFQIVAECKKLNIGHFKGVFMRDELNKNREPKNECLILNIDHSANSGTHWTSLFIKNEVCYYFDSFGLPPPVEVENYLKNFEKREYNSFEIQKANQVICGHFSIYMLFKLDKGESFYQILDELYNFNHK